MEDWWASGLARRRREIASSACDVQGPEEVIGGERRGGGDVRRGGGDVRRRGGGEKERDQWGSTLPGHGGT